jgi:GNAT superfamily N-acetyltransferase
MISIREIGFEEVGKVHDLAHIIWPPTFAEILTKEQIRYMLNWMYDIDTLRKQMNEGHQFFLAEEDSNPIGFMGIQAFYPDESSIKIHKLYVLTEIQGKGVGRLLVNKAEEIGLQKEVSRLILNVNRFNQAVSFYHHIGFKVLYEENIDIGNGYWMEDYVMGLSL